MKKLDLFLLFILSIALSIEDDLLATRFHVANQSPCADDNNNGLQVTCEGPAGTGPWRTIKRAETEVRPGDLVSVHNGTYREAGEIYIRASGTESAPITFRAEGTVIVRAHAALISAFLIHNPSGDPVQWIVIDGFRIEGEGMFVSAGAGIDITKVRNVTLKNNRITGVGTGIVAPNNSDVLIENNEISNSYDSHGIYFSCSSLPQCSNIIIRRNYIHDNNWAAIQFNAFRNGDLIPVIQNALVEENTIENNALAGPAQISAYSLQDSIIRNNRISVGQGATTGIKFWRQPDGGGITRGVQVLDNCISVRESGLGYAVHLLRGSESLTFRGNTLLGGGGFWATVLLEPSTMDTLVADDNLFSANMLGQVFRLYEDGVIDRWFTLTEWQDETGQDIDSQVTDITECN